VGIRSIDVLPGGGVVLGGPARQEVPVSVDAFQTEGDDFGYHYVLALHDDGTFAWATYIGRSPMELSVSAVSDSVVIFAGSTYFPSYPVSGTSWGGAPGGLNDVVVGRLSNAGRTLDWCGFLGGSANDGIGWRRIGLARDDGGHLYVSTMTWSPDLPVTPGAFDPDYTGTHPNSMMACLNEGNGDLQWLSYLGGPGECIVYGLGLLPGRLVCGGRVEDPEETGEAIPTTADALSDTLGGLEDGFVIALGIDDIVPAVVQSGELTWESGSAVLRWRLSGDATDLRAEVVTGAGVRGLPLQQAPDGTWLARDAQACTDGPAARTYRLVLPGDQGWTELWRRTVTPECAAAGRLRLAASVAGGGVVRLTLESPAAGAARVALYDLAGRRVASLPERSVAAGAAVSWEWDGRGLGGERLAGGRYVARCTVGGRSVSAPVLLVR